MGHDTITQTLYRQQKKRVKQCPKTQVKAFFFNSFPWQNFASLHHKELAVSCLHSQTPWKEACDQQSFHTKEFFPPVMEAAPVLTWLALGTGY